MVKQVDREIEKAIREITAHLQTPEGRRSLDQARRDAEALIQDLRKKRRVPWWTLWERVTI